ncbi:TonB-dependent receptor [Mucilaginibacter sp. PPCGB 2223]|uniref:SusC/RagA family TonB-linked outer membrane protein n=1 Tax=Mucilaginibacter sp. PPCGB 2223 TaxID=1886027 RepID=UPI000826AAED|nr:TonB-dependent receptor [Mucilaginibacter sp. PPCGB 2223]OCX52163.1 TonB-dependent receptor [Mucilaginibacter sp. PPCGB 2223]
MVKLFTQKITTAGGHILRLSLLMLVLLISASIVHAQNAGIKVSGTVTDPKGETLIGVTVKVKGTTAGVVTDINGKYTVSVADDKAILVFSYIGYNPHEEVVGTRRTINATLKETSNDLSEVVITGYGQEVKKRDLTGSIATVSAKQIDERQPVTLFDALQGQAAGVLVTNDNGDPSGEGTIVIRGAGTVNSGTGPLYVIDGVISTDANYLNPTDIASIEVLKDAASAAIYGSRGANGVILITTKRGQEGKPSITATYGHLFGKLAHSLPTTSANDLRYYRKNRGDGNNGINQDSVNHYLNADNDYQDLLFRTANKNTYTLGISGGQKGLTYYTGIGYIDDQSIVINSYIKRLQSTINVDFQPNEKFKVTNNLSFAYQTGNDIPVGTSIKQIFERNPWTAIYRPDGTLASYVESKRNPVAYALLQTNGATSYLAQYNVSAIYSFTKDLKLTGSFNAKLNNPTTQSFTPTILTSGGTGADVGSSTDVRQFSYQVQTFLNYHHTFKGVHNLNGTLGFSREHFRSDEYDIGDNNYLSELVYTSNVGIVDLTKTGTSATAFGTESLFGRLGYDYKSRYILTGTYRRDGSSRFGPNSKWGNFYSGAIAWRFTDEKFMSWTRKFLDDGKLRYSFGQLGNDQLSKNYLYATLINFGSDNTNASYNGNSSAALSSVLGNNAIKWETTTTQNFGMDLTFLKGRLTFTPEYYIKKTSGLLYPTALPEETGSGTVTVNLGDIDNRGLELTLTGSPIVSKDFNWNISANATFQQAGLITALANHTTMYTGSYIIQEGGHVGDFYLYKNLGVYQYDVSNSYAANGDILTPVGVSADGKTATSFLDNGVPYTGAIHQLTRNGLTLKGGNVIWQDVNNDGVIDANDKQILGNGIPPRFFGLTNYFTYKRFTLNVTFNASFGNKVYNSTANGQNANSSTYSPPTVDAIYNSWLHQGDIAKYPLFTNKDTYGDISNGTNSLYLENGSYIRLANVKLTYSISPKLISKIRAKSFLVYAYGDNLLTWTDYSWFDPEFSGSVLTPGFDNGKYPKRREIGFGVNIGF